MVERVGVLRWHVARGKVNRGDKIDLAPTLNVVKKVRLMEYVEVAECEDP
jgi:hypothetical protein